MVGFPCDPTLREIRKCYNWNRKNSITQDVSKFSLTDISFFVGKDKKIDKH